MQVADHAECLDQAWNEQPFSFSFFLSLSYFRLYTSVCILSDVINKKVFLPSSVRPYT